jgi:NAD(P)H-flavin reductase
MTTTAPTSGDVRPADPMTPLPYTVVHRRPETPDTVTLWLAPVGHGIGRFLPGQFTMLYAPRVGEIPVSISGDPGDGDGLLVHTIRAVGAVSRALADAAPGRTVGVRGPYGTHWDLAGAQDRDLVVVGGGCGLAPLRPVLLAALADRVRFRRILAVLGARTPHDLVFAADVGEWAARDDLDVVTTVDVSEPGWPGRVGLVTEPLADAAVDPGRTTAFLCGPQVMIFHAARLLLRRGVPPHRIQVSLERSMKCGIGRCGHCQLGPLLLCRDGPVLTYDVAAPLLAVREL